ncbi:hypothetical protein MJH54_28295, partial [Salmonella enterica subsp. enterica serovar Montevideo]|nr:hypothetical protein [Salmonella enterica subsp. enterica serovar Montevideo]
ASNPDAALYALIKFVMYVQKFPRIDDAALGEIEQVYGTLVSHPWARISGTMGILLEKRNMYIDDSSGLTPTEVRSRARRIFREHG